jgi:hypothetical protein
MEFLAGAPSRGKGAGDERTVEKKNNQRRGDHDFLRSHAGEAGEKCGDLPAARVVGGGDGADEAVKSEEIEKTSEGFGALYDVGD